MHQIHNNNVIVFYVVYLLFSYQFYACSARDCVCVSACFSSGTILYAHCIKVPGLFSFWLLPGVIFHRHHAIFVLCEDNKWPNRYQQTARGVSTDRGWKRGPKCCWINWCSLSLTPRLSPPFQTCTTNTFNASNASFVGGRSRRLIETDRRREWEIFTRFTRYRGRTNIGSIWR